ncbi:hypothetical protein MF672_038715 [Actinomadura sp. ATCC 31491]|uniref:Uncharacterized protein n=1 Tax=Actinomadura luzonensis TaxID=2805427 RepID=A0ABT0G508_9ACTN|nr:hypothetical protein [Actinomadura luzonensis]MCK2219687.1 hypothetical protein [Actinomadura luzonensis]
MTDEREDLPDLDEARALVEASQRQSEHDMSRAEERARRRYSLAERLRRLREENGFAALFEEAFGGGGRG